MKKLLIPAVALGAMIISTGAEAAGYHLSEYTTTGLGRSFAGVGVMGDDYSAIGFNPAGMQYNAKSGGQTGLTMVSLHTDYKGSVGPETDALSVAVKSPNTHVKTGRGHTRPTRVLPNIFAQHKMNDRMTFGIGAYVPYGLATDYDDGWFGETHAGLSEVSAVNVSPALSYQVTDTFALGAALNIQHISARLTSATTSPSPDPRIPGALTFDGVTNNLEGDDVGVGYTIGATFTPRKDVRLGVSYRSKIKHKLEGDLKLTGVSQAQSMVAAASGKSLGNGNQDIFTKITTPEVVLFSGAWDFNKCFTLTGTARWTRWSQFDDLDIYSKKTGAGISKTNENWKNTWYYAVGLDYRRNQNWTFRTGIGYDETVIKSPEYRTARIPDGRRVLTSLGVSYKKNNWQIDAGYMHIFIHGSHAYGKSAGASDIDMKYSSSADLLSFGVQYKF
ncbi:MAG: transporter [Alphaproteobacteria bacterium]|nr:transporter [Alphaproteobacteria bacterium]